MKTLKLDMHDIIRIEVERSVSPRAGGYGTYIVSFYDKGETGPLVQLTAFTSAREAVIRCKRNDLMTRSISFIGKKAFTPEEIKEAWDKEERQ